tara:strand:- start:9 stop:131 length:123 start_codon:yes stop_codon:yes gene_type:complete
MVDLVPMLDLMKPEFVLVLAQELGVGLGPEVEFVLEVVVE